VDVGAVEGAAGGLGPTPAGCLPRDPRLFGGIARSRRMKRQVWEGHEYVGNYRGYDPLNS
jgi:hypothetical protein